MKNTMKKQLKKSLSMFLAVLMLMTSWVWLAPEKAEAVSTGYTVTMDFSVENACNGAEATATIYYVSDDGTGTENSLIWNLDRLEDVEVEGTSFSLTSPTVLGRPSRIVFAISDLGMRVATITLTGISINGKKILEGTWNANMGWYDTFSKEFIIDFSDEQFPAGYDYDWDKYSFSNLDETISSNIYKKGYGNIKGTLLHALYEDGDDHGHCYGMTSTTAALLANPSAVNYFKSPYVDYYVGKIHELFPEYISDLFGVDLRTYIKYGYIYQFDRSVQKAEKATKNNLSGLYNAVKSYVNGNNNPVIINVYHDTFWGRRDGHSIFAVGIKETIDNYIILINDSNIYYEMQELKISKDFTSWSYEVDSMYEYSSSNGHCTYSLPADTIYNVGLLLNDNRNSFMSTDNNLVSSTNKIYSEFDLEEILPATGANQDDNSSNLNLYWLDEEDKKIKLTSLSDDNEIIVSDTETSLQITLSNNEKAEFYVNDEDNSVVVFDASVNNEIILTTYEGDRLIETKITGTANGTEITATQTETGLLVTGISDGTVTLSKDDEVVATQEIKDAESDIEINYDYDSSNDDLDVEYHSHSYKSTITTPATCTEVGVITYTCECSDSYTEVIPKTGHKDDNGDYICDNNCGYEYEKNDELSDTCTHLCHKTGFMGIIWKILRFFYKLFGSNPVCQCGIKHY